MMREIKFRAWDKVDKCMKRVHALDFSEWWVATNYYSGEKGVCDGERNSFKNEETDRHILMQYTGIKDKNGVEIYEGDIVHCWGGESCQGYHEYDMDITVDDEYQLRVFEIQEFDEYYVIRNIHEEATQ